MKLEQGNRGSASGAGVYLDAPAPNTGATAAAVLSCIKSSMLNEMFLFIRWCCRECCFKFAGITAAGVTDVFWCRCNGCCCTGASVVTGPSLLVFSQLERLRDKDDDFVAAVVVIARLLSYV